MIRIKLSSLLQEKQYSCATLSFFTTSSLTIDAAKLDLPAKGETLNELSKLEGKSVNPVSASLFLSKRLNSDSCLAASLNALMTSTKGC